MKVNYSKFDEIAINNIKPEGWLKNLLKLQAEGLTGHLEVAGYPFNTVNWYEPNAEKEKEGVPRWWPYEQNGYWVDAMERCGLVSENNELIKKAEKSLDYVINNPDTDGYLGPEFMKGSDLVNGRWSHTVLFRALMAKYSATKDKKILERLTAHYLDSPFDYSVDRDITNIEIMLWLYFETNNEKLLELAETAYQKFNAGGVEKASKNCDKPNAALMKTSKKPFIHGVTYNETYKLGAILYMATGKKEYLKITEKAYEKIDRYFMLVDGLHCSEEETHDNNYMRTHEACDISDYTWGLGYLLMATGDAKWADRIERCVFNAGIGQTTEDFRAAQYFSCPNQVVLGQYSNHAIYHRGILPAMCYRPKPMTECCPANVSRFFPNYCARMFMQKGNDIFALLYGASKAKIGDVNITETTEYPFDDTIKFTFNTKEQRKFTFNFRIPAWCENPVAIFNGDKQNIEINKGFASITADFKDGDEIILTLPSEIKVLSYHGDGNFVEKGPLVYSYGMYGKREIAENDVNQNKDFPSYNIYPDKDWNYAICTDEKSLNEYEFVKRETKGYVWDIHNVPYVIKAPAVKVNGWKLEKRQNITIVNALLQKSKRKGKFLFTPKHPTKAFIEKNGLGDKEYIELVPLASAKLRLTIFPKI